jgi:DNA polymerase-3 subunit delta
MKLPYQQLEKHLAKQLAPIYMISGDELLLVQETVDLIRTTAQKSGYSERVRITMDSDWGKELYANAHSLSLFAEQRILELDLRGVKLNQANNTILAQYAENPAAHTLLLICIQKLDKKVEKNAWYKTIERNGVIIPIWSIPPEQLAQWILQRAKKINLPLAPQAANWLAQQVEGNLLAAAQELEKLVLLRPQSTLTEMTLENIIMNHAHFDVFTLVDSILIGNAKRALHILQTLFAEDIEPTLILWSITRELRTLSSIQTQIQQGTALSMLFSQWNIWEKRQAGARAFLKRATAAHCWQWLFKAAKIDRIIKGAERGNVQDELEQLVLSISGNAIIKEIL